MRVYTIRRPDGKESVVRGDRLVQDGMGTRVFLGAEQVFGSPHILEVESEDESNQESSNEGSE